MAVINYQNLPSTATPLNATNLNNMQVQESGSNSNGNYIKYADGTLIQWNYIEVTDQAIANQYGNTALYIGSRTITFPIAFVGNTPSVQCSQFRWGTGGSWGTSGQATLTTATLNGYDFYSRATGTTCYIGWIAIGKWK